MEAILSAMSSPVDVISAKRVTVLLLVIGRPRKTACEPPFMLIFTKCDSVPFLLDSFIVMTLGTLMLLVLTVRKKSLYPSPQRKTA